MRMDMKAIMTKIMTGMRVMETGMQVMETGMRVMETGIQVMETGIRVMERATRTTIRQHQPAHLRERGPVRLQHRHTRNQSQRQNHQ